MRTAVPIVLVAFALGCSSKPSDPPAGPTPADPTPPAVEATPAATPPEPEPEPEPEEPGIPGGGPDPMTLQPDHSTSVGGPVHGRLEGGVPLPLHGKGYRFGPKRNKEARHGTVELVQALVRAAATAHNAVPGGELTINDLSMPQGGDIPGHATHRAGRDVDVLFYLLDADGKPFPSKAIPLEPDGTGVDYKDLADPDDDVPVKLDVARTWAFAEALVSDPEARLARIYVVEHVRSLLLEHAKANGAPKEAIERFGHLTCQPKFPHDDHFHIRVFCSPEDIGAGCEDTRPIYPWHRKFLRQAKVKPVIEKPQRDKSKKRKKLTSLSDARKKAEEKYGKMHQDVTDFLDRRKTWAKKPHPGREYCK